MENFIIVIFKNKKKKKIIKGYATEKNALIKYNSLVDNNEIIFDVNYENSERCIYEIALLSKIDDYQLPLYKMDEVGRNNKVFIDGVCYMLVVFHKEATQEQYKLDNGEVIIKC